MTIAASCFLFLLLGTGTALAGDMEDAIQDGKDFARQRHDTIRDIPANLDPHTLPNYAGTNVPETHYYTSGSTLQSHARTHAATDPTAQYITGSRSGRPHYPVNPKTDALFTHTHATETNMAALTQTYTGCTPVRIALAAVSVCGSQLICPDGTCTSTIGQTPPTSLDGFKKAASHLAVLEEMTDTFDPHHVAVFSGENKKCKVSNLGFFNCCRNSGIGLSMGMVQCRLSERELALAQREKRTHYVGSYTRCDFFGLNCRRYKSHCVYPSKLARIVVVQGRGQIGKSWGGAGSPDCSGFTLDELPTVDFEAMDLSEFYDDVVATANAGTTPAVAEAVTAIKDKLEQRHEEIE